MNQVWKLNVAHVSYMQEGKYRDAIRYYDPIVRRHLANTSDSSASGGGGGGGSGTGSGGKGILDVSAIVLANLCVSYIMTAQNEEAEEVSVLSIIIISIAGSTWERFGSRQE